MMSKEDYIYKNFVFEDSAIKGEATSQSDWRKTSLLEKRWEFVDETITAKGNSLVVILKMRKKKIFFELEKIEDLTESCCCKFRREKEFKEFKEHYDIKIHREILERDFPKIDFSKMENAEELIYIAAYYYKKNHEIISKLQNMKRNLDN